jgi:hypothetical protein
MLVTSSTRQKSVYVAPDETSEEKELELTANLADEPLGFVFSGNRNLVRDVRPGTWADR